MKTESYESEPDIHSVIGRALIDQGFRERLLDPSQQKEALRGIGITPTDEMIEALNESIDALTALSAHFGAKRAAT